jgi:hypothetical protein
LGGEPKVETTVLEGLLAFVVIPLKLQWRQGINSRSFRAYSCQCSVKPLQGPCSHNPGGCPVLL